MRIVFTYKSFLHYHMRKGILQNVQFPVKVSFTTIGIAGVHYNIVFCPGIASTFNTIKPITCKNGANFVLLLRALKLIVINNDPK